MIALVGQSGSVIILDLIAGLNKVGSEKFLSMKKLYEFKKESYQDKIGYVDSK